MKTLIVVFSTLSASVTLANPFDSFVGNYRASGTPTIQKTGSFRACDRFGFNHITGFSVTVNSVGYHQSHMLRFFYSGGSMGSGWSGHPVSDYKDQGSGGMNAAVTSGDATRAQNEYVEAWMPYKDTRSLADLIVSIHTQRSSYNLTVKDTYTWGANTGVCFYQVTLNRQ